MFLHEHLTLPKIIAIVAGFLGVIFAISPWSQDLSGSWIGYVVAFAGVFFFATAQTWLRVMTQSETIFSMAFFMAAAAMIGFIPSIGNFVPLSAPAVAATIGAGLCHLTGNLMMFTAMRHTTAANVSQFHYSQMIAGAIMGYLVWGDVPSWQLAVGAIIIIGAGLYIAMQAKKEGILVGVKTLG